MRITEMNNPQHMLLEGGNVFKDAQGTILTTRIKRSDVHATVKALEQIVGLPLQDRMLGSVGKKAESGDVDISMDPAEISKDELVQRLQAWVNRTQVKSDLPWIKKSGISVHFRMPIKNEPLNGFVQVDFMFHSGGSAETDWMKFSMYSAGDASAYSGADRNLLLSSLAKSQGLKYSWQKGLIHRDTEQLISKDPDEIAQQLLGAAYDHTALLSVETIQHALDEQPDRKDDLLHLARKLTEPDPAKKPGDVRSSQEEAARITRLIT